MASLEKPVFSRLTNHKQKGMLLEADDSYKGPYCEGISLPQLLYKVLQVDSLSSPSHTPFLHFHTLSGLPASCSSESVFLK